VTISTTPPSSRTCVPCSWRCDLPVPPFFYFLFSFFFFFFFEK
jgi:hypothetical protein